ncbi:MAG: bifunctional demethylmenaquinone methyltransferase/2-methoxy-6-polyprenyl-1,4-benzoquinol methylase UbiE [Bacteroidales bacterium]
MSENIKPYKDSDQSKKSQVALMFDNIALKYDFLNHFLSVGIDHLWRRRVISILKKYKPETILDIATGTGDLALAALRISPKKITGIDISEGMLAVGKQKILKKKLDKMIEFRIGDSENLEFEDNTFDAAMVAFGVRNFENLHNGLAEIARVIKPGAPFVVLEFSRPRAFPVKQLYNFYFKYILPTIGRFFSKDKAAYTYLPASVQAFPEGKDFLEALQKAGLKPLKEIRLTFGVATIYHTIK